jgi:hypothetical protein
MDRKSAPRTRTRAANEFNSFTKAIGVETTIKMNMSAACRRLTPFKQRRLHLQHQFAQFTPPNLREMITLPR